MPTVRSSFTPHGQNFKILKIDFCDVITSVLYWGRLYIQEKIILGRIRGEATKFTFYQKRGSSIKLQYSSGNGLGLTFLIPQSITLKCQINGGVPVIRGVGKNSEI